MKYIKTFENYAQGENDEPSEEPISFEEVYGINKTDLEGVLGYLIDEHEYLDYEITGDYKSFNIEIFDSAFEQDTTQDLKDEYAEFKTKLLPSLTKWLNETSLKIDEEKLDEDSNRIIVKISKLKK